MMPELDGLSALRQIREKHPDTYVIMFTGKGSEKVAVELMKSGAADYILKPFSNQDLIERIENVLKLRRFEIANRELREERERLLREIEAWNLELEERVEIKSRELERAHNEILQGEKLIALGHMSAGMAHEIRNPLNSISLFAQVLRTAENKDDRFDYSEKILGEVTRIDDILVRLLDVSKTPGENKEFIDIASIIKEVLQQFEEQFDNNNVKVQQNFHVATSPIRADREELHQVFSNLFANSLQAMDDGGQISVRVLNQDDGVKIEVSDSGLGIPEENLQKIFDPFFTTKTRGTGFGLSVVLRIVKNFGGRIWVDSQVGSGTVFHILLPAENAEIDQQASSQ
jgi:signal transduction histidine kinase